MSAPNRYLDGLDLRDPNRNQARKTLILWIVLIVLFLVVYNVFSQDPSTARQLAAPLIDARPPPQQSLTWPTIPTVGVFIVAAVMWFARAGQKPDRDLLEAERLFVTGDREAALARARDVSAKRPRRRIEALYLIGRCAERASDFAEALQVFESARISVAPKGKPRTGSGMFLSLVEARRAFALAATGRFAEADELLRQPRLPDAHPEAGPLRLRAEALLLSRTDRKDELRALLDREAETLQNGLSIPDRLLLAVLSVAASDGVASTRSLHIDDDERRFIIRSAPHTASVLEAA